MQWNGNEWEGVDTPPGAGTPAKPESRTKRLAAAALEGALITALTFGLIAGSAFAARGSGGGGGHRGSGGGGATTGGCCINLSIVADANGNGALNWKDSLTFAPTTSASSKPMVSLTCYAVGTQTQIYSHSAGFYVGYPWPDSQTFTLSSAAWTGGAADCTAKGYYSDGSGGFVTFATQSVPVGA